MPDEIKTADPPTAGDALTQPGEGTAVESAPAAVGRYQLVGELARGGMGVVYRARDPGLSRDVAVKVMRDLYRRSPAAVRRFVDEATITGQLQHPGIPPVFEVGELADGSPFLAMKLIKGRTLEAILASGGRQPPVEAQQQGADAPRSPNLLAVFEQICQAVGYAHAHGVIHRDLKPANVMVGAFGEVQVMDWGLAKVLASGGRQPPVGSDDPDATFGTEIHSLRDIDQATQAGSLLGTPAFMPPEQALGAVGEIDERSDVFGLGAILCVILTGRPPFVAGDAESTRLRAARGELGEALAALDACGAEPDLVALCKRCLAVNRDDRPADAGAVAAAVAVLRSEAEERAKQAELATVAATVRAGEERKRRRVVVGAAAAVGVVLAAGAGLSAWQMVRANGEADRANGEAQRAGDEATNARAAEAKAIEREKEEKTARETAEAVSQFMQEVLAQGSAEGQASKTREVKRDLTVKEAMDYAAKNIAGRFKDRPDIEAAVRTTVGLTYLELAAHLEAQEQLKLALAGREKTLGPDHPHTLTCVGNLALLFEAKGDYPAAEPLCRRALAGREKALGPDHPHTLASVHNLARLLGAKGDHPAAELFHKRALAGREKALGPDHPHTLVSVSDLAVLYETKGDYPTAEFLHKRALTGREKALGPDHPRTLASVHNLAFLYQAKGDYPAAELLYRRALTGRETALGPDHPTTLTNVHNLAFLYQAKGDSAAAEPLYRRALAGREKVLGPDHPRTLTSVSNLAALYSDMKRYTDAVPLLERAIRGYAKRPEMAGAVPVIRSRLGLSLLATGKPADAEPHLLAGYDRLTKPKTLSPRSQTQLRQVAQGLVELYASTNRPAEAAAWRAKVSALPRELAPPPQPAR